MRFLSHEKGKPKRIDPVEFQAAVRRQQEEERRRELDADLRAEKLIRRVCAKIVDGHGRWDDSRLSVHIWYFSLMPSDDRLRRIFRGTELMPELEFSYSDSIFFSTILHFRNKGTN